MTAFNHNLMFSPLRGGVGIINPMLGQFGTLGFVGVAADTSLWIVSCYHVLCRIDADLPAGALEPIYYSTDLVRSMPLATLTPGRVNRTLDCAAAQIVNVPAIGEILGIGRLAAPLAPQPGMRVLKSGAETGVSEGQIVSVTDQRVEIAPLNLPPRFDLSGGGDSGALWVEAQANAPVCLHTGGNDWGAPERAYAVPIPAVLEALKLDVLR